MSAEGPPPKKHRRRLRRLLIILGILGISGCFIFRDEDLKPVDDLMPRRPEIAWDDNNGWKRLDDFARALPAVDSKEKSQIDGLIKKEQEPLPAWSRKFTLDASQLSALEAIAAVPLFQSQRYEYPADSGPPGSTALRDLVFRFHVTTLSAMEDNDVRLVLRMWKLSDTLQRKMTAGASSHNMLLYGATLTDPALVVRTLTRLDWEEPQLKELAGVLTGDSVPVDDSREAVFQDFRRTYQFMISRPFVPDGYGGEETTFIKRLFYQRNRTANHYAEQIRVWRDMFPTHSGEEIRKKQHECASSFPRWLDPNMHGTWLLTGGPLHYLSGSSPNGKRAARRMIQVLIALHRCLKVRGSLPARLDELVPEFIPAVPEDPYRAGPLTWNPKHRAVQNTGGEGVTPPVSRLQTKLISNDYRTFLFLTKAEEEAWRASLPPPTPAKARKSTPPAGGK